MQSRLVLATLAAVVLVAPAARASEPKKISVTVVPYAPLYGSLPQTLGDKTARLIAAELAANEAFEVVPLTEGRAPAKGPEAKSSEAELEEARVGVADALALFEKAAELAKRSRNPKPAGDAYEAGVRKFLAHWQGASDFKPLADAYVRLALLKFKLGRDDDARSLLADLVRLDSRRVLDPERDDVAVSFIARHTDAREKALSGGRGGLRIGSTPAGATVTFDGRELGETPLVLKDVLPGEHYVRIVKPGLGAAWKKLTVVTGETASWEPGLAGEPSGPLANLARTLVENKLTDTSFTITRKLGELSKADYVLFGAIHKNDEQIDAHTFMYRTKDGTSVELAALSFDLEMLGAGIEIYKLSEDVAEKSKDWIGTKPMTPMAVIGSAASPSADAATDPISISPERSANAKAPEERKTGGGRVVVGKKEEPKAVVEREPVKEPVKEAVVEEPVRPVLRDRSKKIGEKKEDKPAARKDEGGLDLGREEKGDLGSLMGDSKKQEIDLNAPQRPGSKPSALSPEEMKKLEAAGQPAPGRGPDGGTIALWTGLGLVGAGVVTGAVLFLMGPPPPTSATARITWTTP
jgi:hypothetical protein